MKKRWKVFWITCGVMVGTGLICCMAALGLGATSNTVRRYFPDGIGFITEKEADPADLEADSSNSYSGIREIEIDLLEAEVSVQKYSGTDVMVETKEVSRKLGLRCYQEGSELKLTSQRKFVKWGQIRGRITIYIPENMQLEELSAQTEMGSITIDGFQGNSLSVSAGAGEAVIRNFDAREADFDCGIGRLEAAGKASEEIDLSCGLGELIYTDEGREDDYNYEVECGIGNVDLGEREYSGLGVEQTVNNYAEKEMQIECGMGDVKIYFAGR